MYVSTCATPRAYMHGAHIYLIYIYDQCLPCFSCREEDGKNAHLQAMDGAKERLSLYRADVLDYNALRAAFCLCDGVFHVASPVSNDPVSSASNKHSIFWMFMCIRNLIPATYYAGACVGCCRGNKECHQRCGRHGRPTRGVYFVLRRCPYEP